MKQSADLTDKIDLFFWILCKIKKSSIQNAKQLQLTNISIISEYVVNIFTEVIDLLRVHILTEYIEFTSQLGATEKYTAGFKSNLTD